MSPKIRIARVYSSGLKPVTGPALELSLVWSALLENAIDALPQSGGSITVRTYADGPRIGVDIHDNGCGIPEERQARLFEPFFTSKEVGSGLGLGLFMSRRIIVEGFAGDIRVRSEPGATTVAVQL